MHRLLASIVLIGAAACAPNGDEGILVTKNVVPGQNCTFLGDSAEGFFPEGQWSTLSPGGYLFHPQLQSRITALPGEENERTVIVEAANVDLTIDPALNIDPALTHFKAPFAVPLPPVVGGSLTTADGEFQLIPHEVIDTIIAANPNAADPHAAVFSTLIQASFVVTGKMSGSDVTSQPFAYGVTVGNNVVVDDVGACPIPSGVLVQPGNSCNVYQDGIVTCCTKNNVRFCPGLAM